MVNVDESRFDELAGQLIEAGRFFFSRGWVPATSGNFSARLDDGRIVLTVSGRHKGRLERDDLMLADLDGRSLSPGRRPSAETGLHTLLYRRNPQLGAVLHTHSARATVLSMRRPQGVWLRDYEVLKAFPGIETHTSQVHLPVFANDQDIGRLAAEVERHLDREPASPGYLIAGHGLYTWGETVSDALRHVEALEFLFECELLQTRFDSHE